MQVINYNKFFRIIFEFLLQNYLHILCLFYTNITSILIKLTANNFK